MFHNTKLTTTILGIVILLGAPFITPVNATFTGVCGYDIERIAKLYHDALETGRMSLAVRLRQAYESCLPTEVFEARRALEGLHKRQNMKRSTNVSTNEANRLWSMMSRTGYVERGVTDTGFSGQIEVEPTTIKAAFIALDYLNAQKRVRARVTSAWRSPAKQRRLVTTNRYAIESSSHPVGMAVDMGIKRSRGAISFRRLAEGLRRQLAAHGLHSIVVVEEFRINCLHLEERDPQRVTAKLTGMRHSAILKKMPKGRMPNVFTDYTRLR